MGGGGQGSSCARSRTKRGERQGGGEANMGVYSGYCRERTYRAYAPPSSRGAAGRVVAGRPVRVSRARPPTPPRSRSRTPPRRGTPPATSSDGSSTVRALLHRGGLYNAPAVEIRVYIGLNPYPRIYRSYPHTSIRSTDNVERSVRAVSPLCTAYRPGPVGVRCPRVHSVRRRLLDRAEHRGAQSGPRRATRTTYDVRACRCQPGKIVLT